MKHRNNRFFIWFYYPMENHTLENCESLYNEVYKGWPSRSQENYRIEERNILGTFQTAVFTIWSTKIPGTNPPVELGEQILAIGNPTSSINPRGYSSNGLQFERRKCISLEIKTQDEIGKFGWDMKMIGYLRLFEIFYSIFKPIFGFGHRDYNGWWDASFHTPPFETRVWPYNMYDLQSYPKGIKKNLEEFAKLRNDEWTLKLIDDRFAVIYINDLKTWEKDITPEVTRDILGESESMLVPAVGYPPPTRWWK